MQILKQGHSVCTVDFACNKQSFQHRNHLIIFFSNQKRRKIYFYILDVLYKWKPKIKTY